MAIVRNVNVKRANQKAAHRIFPLSIDDIKDFTYEDAVKQYERAKKAGWLKN